MKNKGNSFWTLAHLQTRDGQHMVSVQLVSSRYKEISHLLGITGARHRPAEQSANDREPTVLHTYTRTLSRVNMVWIGAYSRANNSQDACLWRLLVVAFLFVCFLGTISLLVLRTFATPTKNLERLRSAFHCSHNRPGWHQDQHTCLKQISHWTILYINSL